MTLWAFFYFIEIVCHFDEGEIFARNSPKIDMLYGATYEDFSFVEMARLGRFALKRWKIYAEYAEIYAKCAKVF